MATKKANPSWIDIKAKLADFDRDGLLGLVQDLYAAGKDNQAFLHARLRLGDDVLKPYKATINRWLWPDVFKNQDISVAKAKKAIGRGHAFDLATANWRAYWLFDRLGSDDRTWDRSFPTAVKSPPFGGLFVCRSGAIWRSCRTCRRSRVL